jgi:hypothetical protein
VNVRSVARILQEEATPTKVGKKTSVFLNRMMMRMFSVPAVLQALSDVGIAPSVEKTDKTTIQLDFQKLPQEAIPAVINLIASPTKMKFLRYVKNGQARYGFEFDIAEEDLPGEDFDVAN